MPLFRHTLHPITLTAQDKALVSSKLTMLAEKQRAMMPGVLPVATANSVVITLTTVSQVNTFDSYINIQFRGQAGGPLTQLLVDSGNSTLIVPNFEELQGQRNYTVLGDVIEPFSGKAAKIVRGPIEVPTATGELFTIENCTFIACCQGPRTANFGVGCLNPWSAGSLSTPDGGSAIIQSPLSYNTDYRFAVFNYAAATNVLAKDASPRLAQGSEMVVSKTRPEGYWISDIVPNVAWMSLVPKNLSIGEVVTQWPGNVPAPIAMVDTGGGPVFLSDSNGYLYGGAWPDAVACPTWTSDSDTCNCIRSDITVALTGPDGQQTYTYTIREEDLPAPAQGLTLVMCKTNSYMQGQQGMNIGGLSALFNSILIDYTHAKVGLKSK